MRLESRYAPFVGKRSAPLTIEVERGHIRRFADAIGDANPIYRDKAAAERAGYDRMPAPPTFAIALRPNDAREGVEIDWTKLLHGEQEFKFARPIYAGDRLTLVQEIVEATCKSGRSGEMDVMVLQTQAHDQGGALVFTARARVFIRR